MKKSSTSSLKKKGLLIYLSSIKMNLAINFLKKKLLHLAKNRAGGVKGLRITPLTVNLGVTQCHWKKMRSKLARGRSYSEAFQQLVFNCYSLFCPSDQSQ